MNTTIHDRYLESTFDTYLNKDGVRTKIIPVDGYVFVENGIVDSEDLLRFSPTNICPPKWCIGEKIRRGHVYGMGNMLVMRKRSHK